MAARVQESDLLDCQSVPDFMAPSSGPVLAVAWSADGSTLASGGGFRDNKVKTWSSETGECLKTFEGHG